MLGIDNFLKIKYFYSLGVNLSFTENGQDALIRNCGGAGIRGYSISLTDNAMITGCKGGGILVEINNHYEGAIVMTYERRKNHQ
jgi:hypothetical protein